MCSKLDTFLDVFDFNLKKPPARVQPSNPVNATGSRLPHLPDANELNCPMPDFKGDKMALHLDCVCSF